MTFLRVTFAHTQEEEEQDRIMWFVTTSRGNGNRMALAFVVVAGEAESTGSHGMERWALRKQLTCLWGWRV